VKKRDIRLAEWLLGHGANPNAGPARDKRLPQRSLYELALLEDLPDMAELLARHGASRTAPVLADHERFVQACLRLDRAEAHRLLLGHPEYLQSPAAMFEAAKRDRPDALTLLLDLGFPLEIGDRSGKRALHEAAASNAVRAAAFLVEHGAEIDPRESNYNASPIGWAGHGDKTEMLDLLSRHSRDIWTLCFRGYVDRVREILTEDPARAQVIGRDGHTPLFWLPDDEGKAMQIVELLLAAGADPTAKSKDGRTAADWARRRGMREAATRLELAAGPSPSSDRQ
jgi:ankyrin repeat protein